MRTEDYTKLLEDLEHEILLGARSVGVLGLTPVTLRLLASLAPSGLVSVVDAVYVAGASGTTTLPLSVPTRPFEALAQTRHDVLVVAADDEKQELLNAALPHIRETPKVLVAGYAHLEFRDPVFRQELAQLLVPSLANGYPNSLIHLYQCLKNSARLGLRGVVAEFGMFKGGTTMFLLRVIERLGTDWLVVGFRHFRRVPAAA